MQLPTYLQIEPVGQCNLRCQMCPIPFRQDGPPYGPPAFMDFAVFTKIIDDFNGLKELHLQGLGEPMMHPRFFDMVGYAVNKGIRVTTNTNMTLLNERRAELCVTSGLDCVHASLDGATAGTFERIRLRAKFEKVMRNLELLNEARKRLQSSTPRLHLVAVIMKQNLHELPELVRLAHRWSAETLFVQQLCHDFGESSLPSQYRPMRDFVEKESLLSEDLNRVEEYFGEARKVAAELNIELRLPRTRPVMHPPGTPGRDRCSWPWTGAYISYQGLAMPCCMVATPDRMNFGSVVEDGVSTVWNNQKYQDFRDKLASDTPPEICQSCSIYLRTF
jgi:radical SAM protein with 4Fe4S-binding SPASM domain